MSRGALGLAAVGVAGLGYAYLETKLFTLRRVTVPVLTAGSAPVRVLQVSDLHMMPNHRRKIDWVRSLAELRPDYVINTGDNWAHPQAMEPLLQALEPLLDTPGAFVLGSNDYFAPKLKNPALYLTSDARRFHPDHLELPAAELAAEFRAAGWAELSNRRASVTIAGQRVDLVGVDDPHIDRDVFPAPAPANAEVAAGSSAGAGSSTGVGSGAPFTTTAGRGLTEGDALRIGVVHAPYTRVLNQMHADGVQLIIAGHTHGGQLCVPGFGALVTNCDIDRKRAKGLHGWPGARPDEAEGNDSTWLHVSAGAGTSPYTPVRFACRPEATLITLTGR